MSVFTVNHISLIENGQYGPWGYALLGSREIQADSLELRGIKRETLERLKKALPVIKAEGLVLTVEADVRTEERVESFTTKAGEAATKKVVRVYLESSPTWAKVPAAPAVEMGNLDDILNDVDLDDAPINLGDREPF